MNSIDSKIIARLMSQARTSWADLGTLLGMSAPAAADRVRRLKNAALSKAISRKSHRRLSVANSAR